MEYGFSTRSAQHASYVESASVSWFRPSSNTNVLVPEEGRAGVGTDLVIPE